MIAPLRWILGIIITVSSVLFALANRDPVHVIWSPLHPPATLSVFVLVLGGVAAGFALGGLSVWINQGIIRQERRNQRKLIRKMEEQLRSANENDAPENRFLKLLPKKKRELTTNSHE